MSAGGLVSSLLTRWVVLLFWFESIRPCVCSIRHLLCRLGAVRLSSGVSVLSIVWALVIDVAMPSVPVCLRLCRNNVLVRIRGSVSVSSVVVVT